MKSDIDKAVEAEREACLKELELVYLETPNDRENLEEAIETIRERGDNGVDNVGGIDSSDGCTGGSCNKGS